MQKLRERAKKIIENIKNSDITDTLWHVIVGAFLLAGLGWLIPEIYFETVPAEAFYQFNSPAMAEFTQYKPCDRQNFFFHRWSNIDADASTTLELTLIDKKTGKSIKESNLVKPFVIDKTDADGEDKVTVFVLPCDIPVGEYYWKGVISFSIKNHEKHEAWYSNTFEVKK